MSHTIPTADYAIVSGSAGWGIRFPEDLNEPGVRVLERHLSFETPYGDQDGWQVLEIEGEHTADGRDRRVLNLFSHGWPTDSLDPMAHVKAFWILREAGVKRVLADSTVGALNRALRPTDFVITADVIDFAANGLSTLPGRFTWMCWGHGMICQRLSAIVEAEAMSSWPTEARVYGVRHGLITAGLPGPRFESPAEARALTTLGADMSNQSIAVEAGLAREIGACFVSAAYVANYVSGVLPNSDDAVDAAHAGVGALAARIGLRAVAQFPAGPCECQDLRKERPAKYATAKQS